MKREEDKTDKAVKKSLKEAIEIATDIFKKAGEGVEKSYDNYRDVGQTLIDLCNAYARLKYYIELEIAEEEDDGEAWKDGKSPV